MPDQFHEECGIFGIRANCRTNVATSAYYALYSLQHRGQESCGIAVNDKGIIRNYTDSGLVPEVFTAERLESLGLGAMAIGHTRYAAKSEASRVNAQPLLVRHVKGQMAFAHNGTILNAAHLRRELELKGAIFHTITDAELVSYVITNARLEVGSIEKAVEAAMGKIEGAYCMVVMSPKKLIAARDPHGFRPLCMGKTEDGAVVFASETCALEAIGASFVRDVRPGEIVIVDEKGIRSIETYCGQKPALCVFEFVYFARPDSILDGASVHHARLRAGAFLAQEHPVEADVVIGVPDSGLDAALGYARESGIPYGVGLIKNRYVGRTFIQPTQGQREDAVRIKLSALSHTVKGKRVVMVDDSIVRGTTSANIIKLLRRAGATEVHMRISSPPFTNLCHFGTDVGSKEDLIACRMSLEDIRQQIGADSLGFMSIDAMSKIALTHDCSFCLGCFTGEYPVSLPEPLPADKFQTEIDLFGGDKD